jgi:hypothetical protein
MFGFLQAGGRDQEINLPEPEPRVQINKGFCELCSNFSSFFEMEYLCIRKLGQKLEGLWSVRHSQSAQPGLKIFISDSTNVNICSETSAKVLNSLGQVYKSM